MSSLAREAATAAREGAPAAVPGLRSPLLPEPVAALLARCLAMLTDDEARARLEASAASYARAWREQVTPVRTLAGL